MGLQLQIQNLSRATAQQQKGLEMKVFMSLMVCLLETGKRAIIVQFSASLLILNLSWAGFLGFSLTTEAVTEQDAMLDGEEHDLVDSSYEKIADGVFEDESCELLSEASVEVPYDYITNGSPNVAQRYSTRQGLKRSLAPNATGDVEKQHGKRPARYNRRKQGISTQWDFIC